MSANIGILKYGVVNLSSIIRFFINLDCRVNVIEHLDNLVSKKLDFLIIPGVGSFDQGMNDLELSNFKEFIIDWHSNQKKIIGICLGMQLMAETSAEGRKKGLGLIKSSVIEIEKHMENKKKINSGWSRLVPALNSDNSLYYFTHGLGFEFRELSERNFGEFLLIEKSEIVASFKIDNILGIQFHPEKSFSQGEIFVKKHMESW